MTASVLDAPPAAQSARQPDAAHVRSFAVELQGGLDGPLTILTMLRGRRYDVVDFRAEMRGAGDTARLTLSVALPESRVDVLLERLRRVPVVVDARRA